MLHSNRESSGLTLGVGHQGERGRVTLSATYLPIKFTGTQGALVPSLTPLLVHNSIGGNCWTKWCLDPKRTRQKRQPDTIGEELVKLPQKAVQGSDNAIAKAPQHSSKTARAIILHETPMNHNNQRISQQSLLHLAQRQQNCYPRAAGRGP